jgi:NAD(P)-dependent dehydrogenase (short-subunit alcohol dehydrogenase family)
MKKTVLITGCSSGFGRLAARTFSEKGWNVIATMRSPEKETELTKLADVLVARLDVTDADSIKKAVEEGLARFGAIHVLVNNAGYGGHAVFEQASDQAIRSMYETNVFGVMNVSRAVLPLMRQQKEGRIINVTSMAGMMSAPTVSVYSSTKHAVEGLTEGMAFEYEPLGILVKSVLPGAYPTTRFNANVDDDLKSGGEELSQYAQGLFAHIRGIAGQMAQQGGQEADPQEVVDRIYECSTADTPVHNPVGADSQMIIGMMGNPPRQDFLDKMKGMLLPPQ